MTQKQAIQLFEERKVRTVWDDQTEEWYFSIVDVVGVLTDSVNPTDYIKKMKKRDPELSKGGTNCHPPFRADCWRSPTGELRHDAGYVPDHPVNPLAESGAVQTVDGAGGCRPSRSDAGSGTVDSASNGRLQAIGVFG